MSGTAIPDEDPDLYPDEDLNQDLDEDDSKLFRASLVGVERMKQDVVVLTSQRAAPRLLRPHPLRHEAAPAAPAALAVAPETATELGLEMGLEMDLEMGLKIGMKMNEALCFKAVGLQNKVLKKLRRGHFAIEARLDLHGMTVAEAAARLPAFLAECRQRGLRCVLIIHGKGRGSKDGRPIIKGQLNQWLRQRAEILAFCSARPADGGTGALYVLLKKAAAQP